MNWDQIERKWDEMARRVQPTALLTSTSPLKARPSQAAADLLVRSETAVSPGLSASLIAAQLTE